MSVNVDLPVRIATLDLAIAQLDARRRTLQTASLTFVGVGLVPVMLHEQLGSWSLTAAWIAIGVAFACLGWRFRLSWRRALMARERAQHVEAAMTTGDVRHVRSPNEHP